MISMRASRDACTCRSGATTSNAWKRDGGKTSTRRVRKRAGCRLVGLQGTAGHRDSSREHIMPRSLLPTFLSLLCLAPTPARSAELRVLPAEVTLTGPQATQQLLVVAEAGGK